MLEPTLNQVEKSQDGNYVIIDGREYVSVEHILATQHWLAEEKSKLQAMQIEVQPPSAQQASNARAA